MYVALPASDDTGAGGTHTEVAAWPRAAAPVRGADPANLNPGDALSLFGPLDDVLVRAEPAAPQVSLPAFLAQLGVEGTGPLGLLQDRVPVLAYGSNASPMQLARKFHRFARHESVAQRVIPVLRGQLVDFDVVYAAYISSYGSVTASLTRSPETVCQVFVTFLTREQLEWMHSTEGGYSFCRLEGNLELDDGGVVLPWLYNYHASHHNLTLDGCLPVALKEVTALNRKFPERTQLETQETVQLHLQDNRDLEAYVFFFFFIQGHEKEEEVGGGGGGENGDDGDEAGDFAVWPEMILPSWQRYIMSNIEDAALRVKRFDFFFGYKKGNWGELIVFLSFFLSFFFSFFLSFLFFFLLFLSLCRKKRLASKSVPGMTDIILVNTFGQVDTGAQNVA